MARVARQIIAVLFLTIFSAMISEAALPLWSKKDLSLEATVIKSDEQSGLVVLNRGLSANFRIGAFCDAVILEGDKKEDKLETLLIIEATQDRSVAMRIADFKVEQNSKFRLRLINR